MKKLFTAISLFLFVLVLMPQKSSASHMAGAEIAYVYQGSQNAYLFRLKFYRDCTGIPVPLPVSLCLSSNSLGFNQLLQLNLISVNVVPNPPCVTLPPPNCGPSGNGPGTEEYIFEAIYTLPNAATDWVFSWYDCCRNGGLNVNPNGMYVSATLDNVNHPTDNSPVFNFIPYTTFCVGYPFYYDQGAFDPDGDSLVFSLAPAEENSASCPPVPANLTYLNNPLTSSPYTPTQPVASQVPMTIDSKQGIIYFIPALQQIAVICVLVSSYDTTVTPATLIGTVKRDIQIVITNQCNIVNPAFPPGTSATHAIIGDPTGATAGPYFCGDNQFILPFSEKVQCGSIVPSDIRVLRSLGFPNPVISAVPLSCPNGRTDSIVVTCLFPLTAGSNYVVIKTGADGNSLLSQCGSAMQPYHDTAEFFINDLSVWQPAIDSLGCIFNHKTITFNENVFCYTIASDASDLVLRDSAGNLVPIMNAFGYCGPNGEQSNQMLMTFGSQQTPTSSVYYLTVKTGNDGNTIANQCGRFLNPGDTLAIFYINNKIDVDLGSDLSICDIDPVPVLNSGYTGLVYQWSFNNNPILGWNNPTQPADSGAGNYSVQINVTTGSTCQGSDTILLAVNTTPTVALGANITDCAGSSDTLDAGSSGLGYQYQWYLNGNGIPGATNQTYIPTVSGNYTALVSNGNCTKSDDIQVNFIPAPVVPQFNNQNQTVCVGSAISPLTADNPNSAYQWSINGVPVPGATNQTFTPSTNTSGTSTISVTIGIAAGNCTATGSMTLTVVDFPSVTGGTQNVCEGSTTFPTFNAGSAPGVTYQWTDQNSNVVSSTNTFTPSITLAANTYNYTVTATIAPGCTATAPAVLNVNAIPVIDAGNATATFCEVNPGSLTATQVSGNSITSYQWSNNQSGATISNITTSGNYIVTATDVNNCVNKDSVMVIIDRQMEAPIVTCNTGSSGGYSFVYTWTQVLNALSYEVNEGSGWIAPNNVNSNILSHGTNNLVVSFQVRAINSSTAPCNEGRVSEPAACSVIVPNVITPNGDNLNDAFTISNIEQYPNNHMTILNRWGKEVFSSKYDNKNNVFKGADLPDGVYFYLLELGDGKTEPLTGTVTIAGAK